MLSFREYLDLVQASPRRYTRDAARDLKMCRVFLEVGASNVAALALYRNRGFVEIGVRRGYYMSASGSENAITMACELMGETIG